MSFVDRIRACRRFDPAGFRPFRAGGQTVGWVRHGFAERLRTFPEVFAVSDDAVELAPRLTGFAERTREVERVLRVLAAEGAITGWRDEAYPVASRYGAPALFQMERAAVPLFGVRAYGIHVNGLVHREGELLMWVGRRSLDKPVAPGKLDQLVAGGQPAGLSLADNLRKEAEEEASIPPALAATAVPTGAVTYCTERQEGLRNDALFVYDLELPPAFVPVNRDGEIAEFMLRPIEWVADVVRDSDAFKFNCSLVVIDFLIRHGQIKPEDPDYLELVTGLHRG